MLSRKEAYKLSKTHHNNNQAEFLVREDLNASLFEAIQKKELRKVMDLIDYVKKNNKFINLKNLRAAISQANSVMIELIIPHCRFSKPSDQYIPSQTVIKSGYNYEDCVKLLLNWNFTVNPSCKHDKWFIYVAVENGYLPIVLQLLTFGIDVNMVNSATGLNLLTIACIKKHYEIVEALLKHNADVNMITPGTNKRLNGRSMFSYYIRVFTEFILKVYNDQDLCDVTCLHIAVVNSDPKTTKLLLEYGAKITNDPKFFVITYLAIINGHEDIFRIFLDYGVKATDVGPQGQTFLHACVHGDSDEQDNSITIDDYAQNSRYNMTKWLLENGADIHLQTPDNTLFYGAVANRHHQIAKLFLRYNRDVQYVSSDGNTALHKAIENDFDIKFIKILLKLNSPVNIVNGKGLTPLILAFQRCSQERWEIIKALLHNNANVNCTDERLMTPLHFMCDVYDDESLEFVTLLLKKGADPNAINVNGKTPFHYACKNRSDDGLRIILLLLKHDANVEAMDRRGWTPLFIACKKNNDLVVHLLLVHNAYVNHKDIENSTPLHIAVKRRFANVTYCLIIHGSANIDILNNNNQTPLQIAKENLLDSQNSLEKYQSSPFFNSSYHDREDEYTEVCLDKINICRDIVKFIVDYAVQLRIAGLKVNEKIIENNSTFIEQEKKAIFEDEIKMMKIKHIGTTNITFYDLLTKSIHFRSRFVKNDIILEALKNKINQMEFSFYIHIVQSRFREAIIRCKLIDSAREYFRKNVYENLPDECMDLILSYFSIDELFIFIRAEIPFNGECFEEYAEDSD